MRIQSVWNPCAAACGVGEGYHPLGVKSQTLLSFVDGDCSLVQPSLQRFAKSWIVFQQAVDQVVVFGQRHHLERGYTVDRDDEWLFVAAAAVLA
jgi:hypothetical protein